MHIETAGTENIHPKRGRGRPRKVIVDNAHPRRGRPPKAPEPETDGQISMFNNLPLQEPRIISLEAAAMHCKCTGRTLKLYFEKHSDLSARALKARGVKGSDSWMIDVQELDRWRNETGFLVFDEDGPMGEGTTHRRVSATERRANLQAEKLEMDLARARDEVLDKTEVYSKLRTAFAHVSKGMENMPQKLGTLCNLSGDVIELLREQMDNLRRMLVMEIKDLMEPEKPSKPQEASN